MFEPLNDSNAGSSPVGTTPSIASPQPGEAGVSAPQEQIVSPTVSSPSESGVSSEPLKAPLAESQDSDAGIADSAAAADPELASKPGFQNLRTSYQKRVEEVQALKQEISQLKSDPSVDTYLKIDAPVDDWKAGEQLDQIRDSLPPYYNKMAWEIMSRHLPEVLPVFLDNPDKLPQEFRPLVEASATAILQSYTGMEPEQIGAAIQLYRQQLGSRFQTPGQNVVPQIGASFGTVNQTPSSSDVAQLSYQYGLDPTNPAHSALLNHLANQQKEMNNLQNRVQSLSQGDEARLTANGEQKVKETIETFKNNLLSQVQIPPGYEQDKSDILRLVESDFNSDPVVIAAKANLEKFHKQGTPDLKAASQEVVKLQTRLAFHFKSISEPRLARIAELERYKTQTSQAQLGIRNIPPGSGQNPNPPIQKGNQMISPDNASNIAVERWRASKMGQIPKP